MHSRSTVVITSRAAKEELAKIKAHHADIVNGMTTQAQRVQAYTQQKAVERAQQEAIQRETAMKQQELASKSYGR